MQGSHIARCARGKGSRPAQPPVPRAALSHGLAKFERGKTERNYVTDLPTHTNMFEDGGPLTCDYTFTPERAS